VVFRSAEETGSRGEEAKTVRLSSTPPLLASPLKNSNACEPASSTAARSREAEQKMRETRRPGGEERKQKPSVLSSTPPLLASPLKNSNACEPASFTAARSREAEQKNAGDEEAGRRGEEVPSGTEHLCG